MPLHGAYSALCTGWACGRASDKYMGGNRYALFSCTGILRRQSRAPGLRQVMGFYEKYIETVTKNDLRTRNSVDTIIGRIDEFFRRTPPSTNRRRSLRRYSKTTSFATSSARHIRRTRHGSTGFLPTRFLRKMESPRHAEGRLRGSIRDENGTA